MVSRVSHCELRDLEWAAVVGPAEWWGATVVVLDEGDDAVGEFVAAGELAVAQQSAFEDREEQLDLVEPRGVGRRVVQEHVRCLSRNASTSAVAWAERLSTMQCSSRPVGVVWRRGRSRNATKFSERVESVTHPATSPSWTSSAANNTAVPWRRYSNSRRTGMPGPGRLRRVDPAVACMPDFSSTDHTTAFSGGFRYRPHTSPAFSQKSGSWLVIQLWICHGLRSSARQIRHTCDAEIAPHARSSEPRALPSSSASPHRAAARSSTTTHTSSWLIHRRPARPLLVDQPATPNSP